MSCEITDKELELLRTDRTNVTYILGYCLDVLLVCDKSEDRARPWTVRIWYSAFSLAVHHGCFTERAEINWVDNAVLVRLTPNQLAQGGPDLGHLAHLVALSVFLWVRFGRRLVWLSPRTRKNRCFELFDDLRDGTFADKCLENVVFCLVRGHLYFAAFTLDWLYNRKTE